MHPDMDAVVPHVFRIGELTQLIAQIFKTGTLGWHGCEAGIDVSIQFSPASYALYSILRPRATTTAPQSPCYATSTRHFLRV